MCIRDSYLFIHERHTETGETQAEGEAGSPRGGWCRTRSQDPRIMTWAKGRHSTTEPPRHPKTISYDKYLRPEVDFLCSCPKFKITYHISPFSRNSCLCRALMCYQIKKQNIWQKPRLPNTQKRRKKFDVHHSVHMKWGLCEPLILVCKKVQRQLQWDTRKLHAYFPENFVNGGAREWNIRILSQAFHFFFKRSCLATRHFYVLSFETR